MAFCIAMGSTTHAPTVRRAWLKLRRRAGALNQTATRRRRASQRHSTKAAWTPCGAAAELLREGAPGLKIRVVNVVDLLRLQDASEHPHGLTSRDFDGIFTADKPIIFAYHGYPSLIHRLAYRRTARTWSRSGTGL
jgi:hypothetical protein